MSLQDLGQVHVVGIGGAGMSGIARILAARGVRVTGCDAKDSRRLAALTAVGVETMIGHSCGHVDAIDTLVLSTAIPANNLERIEAVERGKRVLNRAEALSAIMSGYTGIAVTGTHGKTTTTSMMTVALQHSGSDPSFAIGSELNETGSNAHLGTGELFVVEADESDGTFLYLDPTVAIVTNVEADHLNYWGTFDAIEQGFLDFALGIRDRGGFVVACLDDPGAARLIKEALAVGVDIRTYGEDPEADFHMVDARPSASGWSFDTAHQGVRLGRAELQVFGHHNALNAQAVLVAMIGMSYTAQQAIEGVKHFSGTRRRFDFKGKAGGVRVYDDYAHHPTEIAATLRTARELVGPGRVIVAFQAHHYYRTALFSQEFGVALALADKVIVLEVFAPGETPIPGASGQTMATNVPLPPECVIFEPSWSAVAQDLLEDARSGDIIMTLGAGDIGLIAVEVVQRLQEREPGHFNE
ncbi:MAG: UDP-N-acetylmuramate--L-alanine ligase [Candidatus Nanopelagicales bacterium]|nr:UDP-N-acetylmuramate--L-alanine ligase [Candidatus Nanopelagicales bacterium]